MKKQLLLMLSGLLLLLNSGLAQKSVPLAGQVMKEAYKAAEKSNKKILLIFHASWCGWCHKMDSSLNDPSLKKFFDDHFVISHLTVQESKDKKELENPGAEALMESFNGKDQGLPYWVFLDAKGKLLFDSQVRKKQPDGKETGSNIGCPATADEVQYFVSLLRQLTPLKEEEFSMITQRFLQNSH